MAKTGGGSWGSFVFGPGTQYPVQGLSGVRDMPGVRDRDVAFPDQHGSSSVPDLSQPRTVLLTLGLRGYSDDDLGQLQDAVAAAFTVCPEPRELILAGGRSVFAKVRRRALPDDSENLWRLGQAVIEFTCPDPRVYGPEQNVTTGLPGTGGGSSGVLMTSPTLLTSSVLVTGSGGGGTTSPGFGFPLAFPFDFLTSSGTGPPGIPGEGDRNAQNLGNVDVGAVFTFHGPIITPSVYNVTTGESMSFALTLAADESLIVDTRQDALTVLLQGTASRRDVMVSGSEFVQLAPGPNLLQFRGTNNAPPEPTLSVTWRSGTL